MNISRRHFLRSAELVTGAALAPGLIPPFTYADSPEKGPIRVSQLKEPVAIAMWDFSWILRHHLYGEFADWDKILHELADRGYNAVRIDAMPHFVAADTNGEVKEEFRSIKNDWTPSLWGNDYTMNFRPREALQEFLPKCKKYGIKVGLATWFLRHGTDRKDIFLEEGGLLRAWTETLTFLESLDLLNNVIYVDLLNEYPNWHGYDWFKNEMNRRSDIKQFKLDNPEANVPNENPDQNESRYNTLQKDFYNNFLQSLIPHLKQKFPSLDFYVSLDSAMELTQIDLIHFNALDYHIWFEHTGRIPGMGDIRKRDQSLDYRKIYKGIISYWNDNKASLTEWMEGRIADIAGTASANNIVCGNTEGWGPIMWFDHPDLDWKWVRESAEICVDIALKHKNYKFICTSNFTHPQFKGMWEAVDWHRMMTTRIKKGN